MSAPRFLRLFLISRNHTIPYAHAQTIQENLVAEFLKHKAIVSSRNPPSPLPPAPTPTIFAFSPEPVYTTGRREAGLLTASQIRQLREPLVTSDGSTQVAGIFEAKRGGQITFHGPGQVVIYPIFDIKSIRSEKFPHGLTARQYVELLEETTIETLKLRNIDSFRTNAPGVWVSPSEKIAAVGIHMRRNIASYGVAINVATDLRWFDRIVACGLEGKSMTSIVKHCPDIKQTKGGSFVRAWSKCFARNIWGDHYRKYTDAEEQAGIPNMSRGQDFLLTQRCSFEDGVQMLRNVADIDEESFKRAYEGVGSMMTPNATGLGHQPSEAQICAALFPTVDLSGEQHLDSPVRWKELKISGVVEIEGGDPEHHQTKSGADKIAEPTGPVCPKKAII